MNAHWTPPGRATREPGPPAGAEGGVHPSGRRSASARRRRVGPSPVVHPALPGGPEVELPDGPALRAGWRRLARAQVEGARRALDPGAASSAEPMPEPAAARRCLRAVRDLDPRAWDAATGGHAGAVPCRFAALRVAVGFGAYGLALAFPTRRAARCAAFRLPRAVGRRVLVLVDVIAPTDREASWARHLRDRLASGGAPR